MIDIGLPCMTSPQKSQSIFFIIVIGPLRSKAREHRPHGNGSESQSPIVGREGGMVGRDIVVIMGENNTTTS
jgi:hypothetical protein